MTAVSAPPSSVHSIIQVVNEANLSKIESFFNDSAYREAIENSSTYNSRLCRERRLRMPFLDSQTGVAQNHSALFMSARERLPGLQHGQIYTYPSKRWRKKRRQYLMHYFHPKRVIRGDVEDGVECIENSGIPGANDDSKDSIPLKAFYSFQDEHSKDAWFYDEQDMLDMDPYEEPDPDSDFDYEESYSSKRKRRKPRGGGHHPTRNHPPATDSPTGKRTKGGGRGRKKVNYDASDSDKPFVCDPIGQNQNSKDEQLHRPPAAQSPMNNTGSSPKPTGMDHQQNSPMSQPSSMLPGQPGQPGGQQQQHHQGNHHHAGGMDGKKAKPAQPSPYCDFCLGDARENKKTGGSEELVSCSDCGRSGHPTCLQFTANMIVSVRKYRWQCIECKCCSICGTSDNDDQLLFCDDCDRGYHMYCLSPPLTSPPEGSWSCRLCLAEFHRRD
ncbi:zinc finger protein DPF3 isoform X5 [Nasonia vitripennis]|uniref:PHD-type domain-containing protein n=1 Tax=Nasonia vitripennis TaxID=7425 RepID=A0A7M7LRS8_NASVI|nr:zinc finger protein DPF3 isoform X5 [Nasonia vitripennis]